jgi:hypothetical protein
MNPLELKRNYVSWYQSISKANEGDHTNPAGLHSWVNSAFSVDRSPHLMTPRRAHRNCP